MADTPAATSDATKSLEKSLQERYAPNGICFGCGPANAQGLRIRSFAVQGEHGEEVVAQWTPQPHHQAFPGVLNGGIAGALLDCHGNWAAAHHLMKAKGLDAPPCTVTADFAVTLKRPCPVDGPLELRARVVSSEGDKATVEGSLSAAGKVRATVTGTFVAVGPGHPAYHRW